MKTNNYFSLFMLVMLFIINIVTIQAAPTLKITNLEPQDKSLLIGLHYYHCGDTIRQEDIGQHIHWDTTLRNQAVKIMCLGSNIDCVKEDYEYSQNYDKENNVEGGSKVGLFGKGALGEPIVLWRDSLIPIDVIAVKEGFDYYCSIPNNSRRPKLVNKDGKLYLNSNDFRDLGIEITLEIYSIRESDGDKQTLTHLNVEQVK